MRGKVCLVTGASSGIGKGTALGLARIGATVLMVARDRARGETAVKDVRREAREGRVELLVADLSSLREVRRLAESVLGRHDRLDVLVNNAGVALFGRRVTEDGLEATFATNHLGPFLLTNLLLGLLRASAPSRVVNVSSDTHKAVRAVPWDDLQSAGSYDPLAVYNRTKLMNVLFTHGLARRLAGTGITANALHPGWPVRTGLDRDAGGAFALFSRASKLFAVSAEEGAKTSIYLASSPGVEGVSGGYYAGCRPVKPSKLSRDEATAERLWDVSVELCGL
jgi:NAD(P)-dependent dehydrogenase (short-subunit alcohol dehydrogenase family)